MAECRHCDHEVSPNAQACPNCGEPKPATNGCGTIVFLAIVVFIILAALGK